MLVTGASRGVGRGIAIGLGETGATVYLTARSTGGKRTVELPGTLEETAERVEAAGGRAVPIVCDHRSDREVREVLDRIRAEEGRLDVLVNNAWGGYEYIHRGEVHLIGARFWARPLELWDEMMDVGPRSHFVASALAAPLMIERGRGLIVNVSSFAGLRYHGDLVYGIAKSATDRLARDMAEELREHGIACVSLYPGLVRTESVLAAGVFDLSNSESPEFVGRAVAALAADPNVLRRTGRVLVAAELAEEYGFTDIDGTRPVSLRPQFETPS
jgi:NAD(P)-dependent dehydrogenase (short-subunit alcohol dehydrogenase family)